ncbi:hypothetical protein NL676_026993 [Syzygium grande]|nr:hypothetical protein NL676_026993 [Syzygium grande]
MVIITTETAAVLGELFGQPLSLYLPAIRRVHPPLPCFDATPQFVQRRISFSRILLCHVGRRRREEATGSSRAGPLAPVRFGEVFKMGLVLKEKRILTLT